MESKWSENHLNGEIKEDLNINGEKIALTDGNKEATIEFEDTAKKQLIYGVSDAPPIHVTLICGLQQALLSLATQLVVSLLVANAVCAKDNDAFKVKLLSSTLFMDGVTTLSMVLFGTRLPLFQGAAASYILPLLIIASVDSGFCSNTDTPSEESGMMSGVNMTSNGTVQTEVDLERILNNVRAISGSLMLGGFLHAMMGASGLIGMLLRYVGPITIVPTMLLASVYLVQVVLPLVEVHWGIALSTAGISFILSLYLQKHNTPVPVWTPKFGFRIIWYPLHQVFSILIAILLNWMLCGILTTTGVLTDDPTDRSYKTRTDARSSVITGSPWFNFPYPGQYGLPGFSVAAFFACFIATLLSMLDSIGDYYACARVSRVPPPPAHAVNRGILIEGACSFLSGAIGCGHATTTYGGNIGAIGVTRFGTPGFSVAAFFACFIATILSILDSIGDYIACARVSRVPPPPSHAVNRGILIEGTCSFLSGSVGCGHATTTYGGNIGAIGITKVASRHVFVCTAVLYIIFGIVGKVSAVFITIPYPVLGGASIAMFSAFTGVAISQLQVVSLSSSRNMAVIGIAVILGLMIPTYTNRTENAFNTGNETAENMLTMILGNPILSGTVIAFFLDNTVPGTKEERGISAWQVSKEQKAADLDRELYDEGYEVYLPLMPRRFLKLSFMRYIPFLPHLK